MIQVAKPAANVRKMFWVRKPLWAKIEKIGRKHDISAQEVIRQILEKAIK